jgi:hypothetical protein
MKIFNLVFVILFVLFAALQYNDPDPWLWIPIYGFAAILCWLAFRGKYHRKAFLFGIVAYLGYAVFLFFEEDGVLDWITKHEAANIAGSMKAENPWIEDTREFFGLLIMVTVFTINYFYSKKKKRIT